MIIGPRNEDFLELNEDERTTDHNLRGNNESGVKRVHSTLHKEMRETSFSLLKNQQKKMQ